MVTTGKISHLRKPANSSSSCAGRPDPSIGNPSWGIIDQSTYAQKTNHRRCIVKVSQAVDFHLQYHRANSKKKYGQDK